MRRDYFTLDATGVDWVDEGDDPERPTVTIDFDGPTGTLDGRLSRGGEYLDGDEIDVTFRLKDDIDTDDGRGVVSVTDRVTGEFVLEINEEAEDVLRFVRAARRYGEAANDDTRYRVIVAIDGEKAVTYDKSTFLVYDPAGQLLRKHSLIPSGVEL
ncbi:hypothetical protein BRD17_05150 [Halobacteriales archaeon SW_7_68_16]|nr:MAG: hypothetical protein BRD17_05150 [Halobacteriales archaeon SW_7_68_16]